MASPAGGRAAVLGRPIAQSLSPVLHRAAYAELGLDWSYEAIDCGIGELAGVLHQRRDWAGFSATMPLKHELLKVAAEVTPLAARIGAANMLLPGETGWIAGNTDVAGIIGALRERDVSPTSVTVIGAGGTAQAVLGAIKEMKLPGCYVLVRDRSRTHALMATAQRLGVSVAIGDFHVEAPELGTSLVVSTLPPGAADVLAQRQWARGQAVLDVVYSPWPTPLAVSAFGAGAQVVSGALMLLHQAAKQVLHMTGQPAPVEAMRAALRAAAPDSGV